MYDHFQAKKYLQQFLGEYIMKMPMVKPKLLDQVRHATRVRHLSYRTE